MSHPNGPRWSQVAADPPAERTWIPVVVTALFSVVPMYIQLRHLGHSSRPSIMLLAAVVVLIAVARSAPLTASVLSISLVCAVGRWGAELPVGAAAFAVVLALCWAVPTGAVLPRWRWWPSVDTLRLAFVPLVVADLLLVLRTGLQGPAIALGAALAVMASAVWLPGLAAGANRWLDPVMARPRRVAAANTRLLERVGHPIGRAVGAVVMLPAAVVAVLLWLGYRLVRFDPLGADRGGRSRWFVRQGSDRSPDRAFAEVLAVQKGVRGGVARRTAAAVPLLLALAAVVVTLSGLESGIPRGPQRMDVNRCHEGPDAAMDGQVGSPLVICETIDHSMRARFDAVTAYRFEDYDGEWVNVVDGVRRTWQPPQCQDCERRTVWWFGGSAAWGYFQSDDKTLPSQVARTAWEQGVALEITNYAQPGWTLGQSVREFIELTKTEEPPDVVVFYDGANDVILQRDRGRVGRGSDESEISFAETSLDEVLLTGPFDFGVSAKGRSDRGPQTSEAGELAAHAMSRYGRNVALAESYAAAVGTVPVFIWQPILPYAPARIGNPGAVSDDDQDFWSSARPRIRAAMPGNVVDLSDSLDDAPRVVFKDYVHTNELGAQMVAEAVVDNTLGTMLGAPPGPEG